MSTTPEKFTYKIGKHVLVLPSLAHLPVGTIRKSRHATNSTDQLFLVIETLIDGKDLAAFDTLDAEGLEDLMAKWSEFSGVTLGESSAS